MAQNWAYVGCTDFLTASGPTGSVQFRSSATSTTGSYNFMFYTGSFANTGYHPNTLVLTGTLEVTGVISASHFHIKNITEIDATGSTKFGDTDNDFHQRTGSFGISSLSNIVFHASSAGNVGIGTASPGRLLSLESVEPIISFYDSNATSGQRRINLVNNSGKFDFLGRNDADNGGTLSIMTLDLSNGKVGIGDTSPDALLDLQGASGTAVPTLLVDHLDADVIAIDINTANDTADVIDITADAVTTANVIDITADALTTGTALNIATTATNDSAGSLVRIAQAGSRAGSAASIGLDIDFNTAANANARAFKIDSEQTTGIVAEINGDALTTGTAIDVSTDARTTGTALNISDSATSDNAGSLVKIAQAGSRAGSAASIGLDIDFNTAANANARAFRIDSEQTTGIVAEINADALTTGTAIDISADARTTGTALNISDSATSDNAGSLVKIAQAGSRAGSAASIGLDIDFNTVANANARAFRIDSEQTTGIVAEIDGNVLTTGDALNISTAALTTGKAVYIGDNSANTGTRNSVEIVQDDAAALAATALKVQSDGGITGVTIDKNFTDVTAATVTGLHVDFDQAAASGTANFTNIGIDVDVNGAGGGTTVSHGLDIHVVGTSGGASTAIGLVAEASGADTNIGLYTEVTDGGANADIEMHSSANGNDYCIIATSTNGATTITTVDADATLAHLTMAIDGDITMTPTGGNIAFNDGSNDVFDFDVADPAFKIMDDAQVANYCSIAVGANGETTITTFDTDAAIAHLNFVVDGDIILGPGGGDVLPDADGTRNLGSGLKRWANIYTSDLHLANDRGDWTVIEEENYLTIRSNKTGKRFKLLMEEID